VGAISFAYSGFKSTDVYIVSGSPWTYNSTTGAFYLAYPTDVYNNWVSNSVSGRFLYPQLVQMKDPTTMAVKSFSTSFIFQILINDTSTTQSTGPGLAFLMVPDNVTIGANLDYMGLLTANTTQTSENLQSDNHTLGVEFDTYLNYEFGDPNDNHVGLDLTSMTSSYVFVPSLIMASEDAEIMRQVWIDYDQSDASVDIYIALYGQGKPATPEGSTPGPVDLSFLLEEMYVGFSAAVGIESNNLHTILAWSFSNEGEAPPISIQRDAPTSPGTSPPQGRLRFHLHLGQAYFFAQKCSEIVWRHFEVVDIWAENICNNLKLSTFPDRSPQEVIHACTRKYANQYIHECVYRESSNHKTFNLYASIELRTFHNCFQIVSFSAKF
jgi:hypothetical protein